MLSKTARGFEVAYVAKTVREMMGDDAFRKEAIAAAHDLLSNPIEIPNPNSFDRNSKRFLFNVLEMYDDQTFIESAQGMLITGDGKIDENYLVISETSRLLLRSGCEALGIIPLEEM
mgnify:CR=1 FL=1